MDNLILEKADTLTLPAPSGGVVSGVAYLIGVIFGVAIASVAETVDAAFRVVGEFTLPKNTSEATTVGAALYWDDTGKKLTTTVGSNLLVGAATVAHDAADATQEIVLGYRMP